MNFLAPFNSTFKKTGDCVKFNGLTGTITEFQDSDGNWGIRCENSNKVVLTKPVNLCFARPPPIAEDEWKITDLSLRGEEQMNKYKMIASSASSIQDAEKAVFIASNGGKDKFYVTWFSIRNRLAIDNTYGKDVFTYNPHRTTKLFAQNYMFSHREMKQMLVVGLPFGTEVFADAYSRTINIRFEQYVEDLLSSRPGHFLWNDAWLKYFTNRVALVRAATGRPALYKEENHDQDLDDIEADGLSTFQRISPMRTFCFRYLFGDKKAASLAILSLQDLKDENLSWVDLRELRKVIGLDAWSGAPKNP
jgi:hypothetical protein